MFQLHFRKLVESLKLTYCRFPHLKYWEVESWLVFNRKPLVQEENCCGYVGKPASLEKKIPVLRKPKESFQTIVCPSDFTACRTRASKGEPVGQGAGGVALLACICVYPIIIMKLPRLGAL